MNLQFFWRRQQAEIVLVTICSMWWLMALRFPHFVVGRAADVVAFAPAWLTAYPVILLFVVFNIAAECLMLERPTRNDALVLRSAMRFAVSLGGVLVILFLLTSGDLVVRANAAERVAANDALIRIVNTSLVWTLSIAAIVSTAIGLCEVRRLVDRYRSGVRPC